MVGGIKMHDVVALLQDVRTKHFESGQPLLLRRGQIGTVVMSYQDGAAKSSSPIAMVVRLLSCPSSPIN
jgi:hypothetical protein